MQAQRTTPARKRAPRRPPVDRACDGCGSAFTTWQSAIDQGRGRFCSTPCFSAQRKLRVVVTCEGCAVAFETIPSRLVRGRGRFCSKACYDVAQAGDLIARFWSLVDRDAPGACWPWIGNVRRRTGYGYLTVNNRAESAHRLAWKVATGRTPPKGYFVLHTCDYRRCARNDDTGIYVVRGVEYPRRGHLFLADHNVNMADMVDKHRAAAGDRHAFRVDPAVAPRGERNGQAKLTGDEVDAIRSRYHAGDVSQDVLAREFRVAQTTVSRIVRGDNWQHVI